MGYQPRSKSIHWPTALFCSRIFGSGSVLKIKILDGMFGGCQSKVMPSRASKGQDFTQIAKSIVDQATGDAPSCPTPSFRRNDQVFATAAPHYISGGTKSQTADDTMTMKEAKAIILAEWEKWSPEPSEQNAIKFREFCDIMEQSRPEVFTWRVQPGVARCQDVIAWLNIRTSN